MALPPASLRSLSFASATSPSSSPYVNRLPDLECTTTVDCGSWLAIASNIGSRGKVEAILERGRCIESNWKAAGLRRRRKDAFLTLNIVVREKVRRSRDPAHGERLGRQC